MREKDNPSVHIRVYTLGELHVERRQSDETWQAVAPSEWGPTTYGTHTKSLLGYLLYCYKRQAPRSAIIEALWVNNPSSVDDYLIRATSRLRNLLHGEQSFRLSANRLRYEVADQTRVWVDADHCEELYIKATQIGYTTPQGIAMLEEAEACFRRGLFLEEEAGAWAHGRRGKLRSLFYDCLLSLAEAYEVQRQFSQAERVAEALLHEDATDENALCHLMMALHQQGKTSEALRRYQETCSFLNQAGRRCSTDTENLAKRLQQEPKTINRHLTMGSYSHFYRESSNKDLLKYEKNIRLALHIHRTSNAQSIFQDVNSDIHDLEYLEDQIHKDLISQVRMLLIGNHLLATKIVKDQKQYVLAYAYANNAVRIAKGLENEAVLATTRYNRACTKLEWGLLGNINQGRFKADTKKIQDAIDDFQKILSISSRQPYAFHLQLQGSTQLQLSRAQIALQRVLSGTEKRHILLLADNTADMVGRDPIDEPYTRMMVTGTVSGLHLGGYHLVKAGILNTASLPDKAIIELHRLKHLTEQTYGRDETRYQAWSDITMAEALLGLKEYQEATVKAKTALVTCHHINSVQNVTMITDIYSRVAMSSYGMSEEVKELGDMLYQWYGDEQGGTYQSQ